MMMIDIFDNDDDSGYNDDDDDDAGDDDDGDADDDDDAEACGGFSGDNKSSTLGWFICP